MSFEQTVPPISRCISALRFRWGADGIKRLSGAVSGNEGVVPVRAMAMFPLLTVLFVGCAGSLSPSSSYDRVSSDDGSWGVGVVNPRCEASSACDKDPSVDIALHRADMPSSHLGVRLKPGSTEADALRIADCLAAALTSGEISISSPTH